MPKGDNPKSRANLKPFRSVNEARESGRKGGVKSGITRSFKQLALELTDENDKADIIEVIKTKAKNGDPKMIELLMAILGEKPADVVTIENNEIRVTIDD